MCRGAACSKSASISSSTPTGCASACCASRAATPGLCCNLILPPTLPEADAGFVIMEQTDYPPMSGSNTICVATVLLETGMLPMREPVTELVLEAPAGLVRVTARVRQWQGARGDLSERARFRGASSTLAWKCRGWARSPSTWRTAACSTSSPTRRGSGLRLTPDEGREIVRIGEMLKAAAREQLPVAHPRQPEVLGYSVAQLSGPAARRRRRTCATRS